MPKPVRTLLPVPLGSLDQSTPPTILQPGKMAALINAHVERTGSYEPRPGFVAASTDGVTSGLAEVFSHDDQLLGHDGFSLVTLDARASKWFAVGKVPEAQVIETMQGRRDNYNPGVVAYRECDVIQHSTTRVLAYSHYEGTTLNIYCDVIDTVTGARERTLIAAAPLQAQQRLVCLTNYAKIYTVYQRSATVISARAYDIATRTWGAAVDLFSAVAVAASVPWDACGDEEYIYLVCNDATVPAAITGTLFQIDKTLAVVNSVNVGVVAGICWAVASMDDINRVWVACDAGVGPDLKFACYQTDLTVNVGITNALAGISAPRRIGIAVIPSDPTKAHIVLSSVPSSAASAVIGVEVDHAGGHALTHTTYNVDAISRPIWYNNALYAVLVLDKNTSHQYSYRVVDTGVWTTATLPELQKTAYLCQLPQDSSGRSLTPARVVCRVWPNTIAPIDYMLSVNLRASELGEYLTCIPRIPDGTINGGAGVDIVKFKFKPQGAIKPVRYGDVTLLSGGVPSQFDGTRITEVGWNYYPRLGGFTSAITLGGTMTPGDVYAYVAVYVWIDATGARHWSAPSEPINVTVGAGDDSITGRVDTLTLTERQRMWQDDAPVLIEVYRTVPSGVEYHLMTTLRNDPSAAYANFTDLGADVSSNRMVYSRGGIMPTGCPSCSLHMGVHQGRPWSVPADDRATIVFGHQALRGEAPRMPDGFALAAADGGKYTAIGSLSDKLIAWTANGVDAIYGSGPNQTGIGSSYTEPQPISRAVGAVDHRGVVRHPGGYLFAHASGIWSIGSDLSPTLIGSTLWDTLVTYPSVVAAVCDEAEQRVVLALSNGSTATLAAWYYPFGIWTTWPVKNLGGTAGYPMSLCMWRGALSWSDPIYAYTARDMGTSRADPDGTFPLLTIKTGWLSPSGLLGYSTAWRFGILGTRNAATGIGATIGYDYSTSGQTSHTWTAAETTALALTNRLQLHVDSTRPESESLQLTLVLTPDPSGGTGLGIRIEAITLEAAPQEGLFEVQDGARR